MSGHSKWSTIKRKKGANDAKRGQLFAKLVKAIEIAARNGGTDPANNSSLYQAIQKAKSNSVPNENIERALKRVDGNSIFPSTRFNARSIFSLVNELDLDFCID